MAEPKNFGVNFVVSTSGISDVSTSAIGEKFARLRREVESLANDIREVGPHFMRAGLRPVVLWLPNTSDHDYRARIADQCRRLAELTADEETMAVAFEKEATQTPGWR
jgi:hypothetical protein